MAAVDQRFRGAVNLDLHSRESLVVFTASGQLLDTADKQQAAIIQKLAQEWQLHVWSYYKQLGLIHFAHDYAANCCSRVRLFPGYRAAPDQPPIPLDDLDDPDEPLPDGADKATVDACVEEMQHLDDSALGGLPAIAGDFGLNIGLVGEGYLHGYPWDESVTGERYVVRSVTELKSRGGAYYLMAPAQSTGGRQLGADEFVGRVWRSDRQYRDLADAPMRALLDDCDTLLALKRVLLASTYSRAHGGLLKVPSELLLPRRADDPSQQAADDPTLDAINRAVTTAIADPSSVNTVAPIQISGPAAYLKELALLDLGRGYGDELLKQISQVSEAIATGLDLPNEVITGLGDVNHWGAWQIDEQTFKAHIEPLLLVIIRGLLEAYLWPKLRARGITENLGKYVIGYDPSQLIGHPNQEDNAFKAYNAFELSGEALLRVYGFSNEDMPDEDEIAKRLYIIQQQHVRITEPGAPGAVQPEATLSLTPGEKLPGEGEGVAPGSAQTPGGVTKAAPEQPPVPVAKPSLTASARPQLRALGARQSQIDRDLLARLSVLADLALQRALERAGAVVKRKMGQADKALAGSLRQVPVDELARKVGKATVTGWGIAESDLIDGQLAGLEPQFHKLTKRAIGAAFAAANAYVPDDERFSADDIAAQQDRAEPHIAAGFALLSAGIVALAHDRLFSEPPGPPPKGEIDMAATVPTGLIRDSMALAGGGQSAAISSQGPGGVALGPIVMSALQQELAIFPSSFQWVYGYPDREFPPHADLEGVEFSSWDDDVLANTEGWPDTAYLRPGDHQGCLCSYMPMFQSDRPADETAAEEEA